MPKANTQALCPMCGVGHGFQYRREQRVGYVRLGEPGNYWSRVLGMYDLDKEFGVEFGTGKAGLKNSELFDIEDPRAEPFIEPMGELVLLTVRRAIRIGLVTKEELVEAIEEEST